MQMQNVILNNIIDLIILNNVIKWIFLEDVRFKLF